MHTPLWSSPHYSPEARAALHRAAVQQAGVLRHRALDAAAAGAARWLRAAAQRALQPLSTHPCPSPPASTHPWKA